VTGLRARARDVMEDERFLLSDVSPPAHDDERPRGFRQKEYRSRVPRPSPPLLPLLLLLVPVLLLFLLRRQASRAIFAATPVFSRRVIYGRPLRDGAIEFLK